MSIDQLKQNRQRVAQTRQRKRDAGLVPKEVWVYPEHWPQIKALIQELTSTKKAG